MPLAGEVAGTQASQRAEVTAFAVVCRRPCGDIEVTTASHYVWGSFQALQKGMGLPTQHQDLWNWIAVAIGQRRKEVRW